MKDCDCLLCQPDPARRGHPVYGYELDKVPAMVCVDCGEWIGDEPYVEELGTARFGQMSFRHQRCETPVKARARERMERNWRARRAREEGDTPCPNR